MMMNEEKQLILDTTNRIMSDLCTPEVVDAAEKGEFPAELWKTLEETGLTLAGFPESMGGSGGSIEDSLMIVREAARFGAPIPLAETFIAARLVQLAGGSSLEGPSTIALGKFEIDGQSRLTGRADGVSFARWCRTVVFVANQNGQQVLCSVPLEQFDVVNRNSMAGEPRDSIKGSFDLGEDQMFPVEGDLQRELELLGAVTRSVMMSAALESILELSVQYALDRNQFGRPIARFQAIQQQLAVLAGEVAASIRAADAVIESVSNSEWLDEIEVAVAKSRIGDAVGVSTDIAHQVHGAMGYTMEHVLNHRTRRLWCWRDEFGGERVWWEVLGKRFAERKANMIWSAISKLG
jgi:acyl-CoA dehydrogenase